VPDPFAAERGARLYRTGDLVRLHDDSRLEFLGRLDEQLKISGHRVEPREVAVVLEQHPAIKRAAVITRGGAIPTLSAYLIADGEELASAELRAYVEAHLPRYMAPARFTYVEELPLTANGKLDVRALAGLNGRTPAQAHHVEPENDAEAKVLAIWRDVLGRHDVGVEDNFFDVGGTSLALALVHGQAEAALGKQFDLVEALKFPTVRTLAEHLSGESNGDRRRDSQLDAAAGRAERRRLALAALAP
jgi:acyl carrier protein